MQGETWYTYILHTQLYEWPTGENSIRGITGQSTGDINLRNNALSGGEAVALQPIKAVHGGTILKVFCQMSKTWHEVHAPVEKINLFNYSITYTSYDHNFSKSWFVII